MPILRIQHPAIRAFVLTDEAAFARETQPSSWLLPADRYRQIRCTHTICINSSARDFTIVVYVFGAFETRSIATFEIVEVCGCVAVTPDNCTAINEVSIA